MTNAQIECFRNLLFDFEGSHDYAPEMSEWQDYVAENISPTTEEFRGLTSDEIMRLASTAYAEMDTVDSMRAELNRKVRDSESNLNNRKYNFGNF
jgi:hypothetical protein